MSKKEQDQFWELIEQMKANIDDDKERYGGYSPVLEAQKDILNELQREFINKFKYNPKQ